MKQIRVTLLSLFLLVTFSCSKSEKIIDVEGNWSEYIELKLIAKDIEESDYIYPQFHIEIKKIFPENINGFTCIIEYDYGYKYFSKKEILTFKNGETDLSKINEGLVLIKEFKYDKVKAIELKEGEQYNMIMHGIKAQAIISEIIFN